MSGRLITLFPQGSLIGNTTFDKTTPPTDVRGYPKGTFTMQLDGYIGGAVTPTALLVEIQSSNDGVNWYNCANQFNGGAAMNYGVVVPPSTMTDFVDDLGAFVRLHINIQDAAGPNLGVTMHVHAALKEN